MLRIERVTNEEIRRRQAGNGGNKEETFKMIWTPPKNGRKSMVQENIRTATNHKKKMKTPRRLPERIRMG